MNKFRKNLFATFQSRRKERKIYKQILSPSLGMTLTHLLKHGTKSINNKNYNNRKKENEYFRLSTLWSFVATLNR